MKFSLVTIFFFILFFIDFFILKFEYILLFRVNKDMTLKAFTVRNASQIQFPFFSPLTFIIKNEFTTVFKNDFKKIL